MLVAYATRNGSTAEIATAVGKELESAGHSGCGQRDEGDDIA